MIAEESSTSTKKWWHTLLVRQFFAPRGFLVTATELSVFFLLFHLAGLRGYTSILIGASASPGLAARWASGLGFLYIVFYFLFVVGVPILVIGAAVFHGLAFLAGAGRTQASEPGTTSAVQC